MKIMENFLNLKNIPLIKNCFGASNSEKTQKIYSTKDEDILYHLSIKDIDLNIAEKCGFLFLREPLSEEDLISLGIMKKNCGKLFPTVGGIILFGKNRFEHFPNSWLKVGVFEKNNKSKILNKLDVTCSLPESVHQIQEFCERNIRTLWNSRRDITDEICFQLQIILHELIVNSIIHKDYQKDDSPVHISIFEDRIEIENNFCGNLRSFNYCIQRTFYHLKLANLWKSGMDRIKYICEKNNFDINYTYENKKFKAVVSLVKTGIN